MDWPEMVAEYNSLGNYEAAALCLSAYNDGELRFAEGMAVGADYVLR